MFLFKLFVKDFPTGVSQVRFCFSEKGIRMIVASRAIFPSPKKETRFFSSLLPDITRCFLDRRIKRARKKRGGKALVESGASCNSRRDKSNIIQATVSIIFTYTPRFVA